MTRTEFKKEMEAFFVYLRVERNLAENTQRAYASDLNQFLDFWSNKMTTDEQKYLTIRQIIERYLVSLFYNKIDKSSIARKFSCFKSFEKFLRIQGIKLELKLTRPRLDKKLPVYLSVDEMFHLLDGIKEEELPSQRPYRDKAILELMYATGIRCSELVAIRCRDIDMEEKTIRIFGKGRKERIVLFGDKAKKRIESYCKHERSAMLNPDEALFLNYRGQQLTSRSIQRIMKMFRRFLKLERPITPHKIRHTFATHMLNQGVDLRIVQELLGHKTLASTEKYTHVSLQDLAKMCDTIHPLSKHKTEQ